VSYTRYGLIIVFSGSKESGYFLPSEFNWLENNRIVNSDICGILLHAAMNNTITTNVIDDCTIGIEFGKSLWETTNRSSGDNQVIRNNIVNSRSIGMIFTNNSENNLVGWNNFENNPISAIDCNVSNKFIYNYYSSHVTTDKDNNSICDEPFRIMNLVFVESVDPYPIVVKNPITCQFVPDPTIIDPYNGQFINTSSISSIVIHWSQETCYSAEDLYFNVYYNQSLLITTTDTFFEWDITSIADGNYNMTLVTFDAANNARASASMVITVKKTVMVKNDPLADFIASPLFLLGVLSLTIISGLGIIALINVKKITPEDFFNKYIKRISKSSEKRAKK